MAIDRLSGISSLQPPAPIARPAATRDAGFGDALSKLVSSVDTTAADANAAIGRMLDGTGDVHEAVIAVQKADTALQLTVQIRNKLVQAYQDIMRMPV